MLSQSHGLLLATPWTAAHQGPLSFTAFQSLLKLMSIELVMPSNHLIFCCPRLLLPSVFPSIRVFSGELALCIRWPKHWRFSFSISPSRGYSGLISFGMNSLDLLSVQGTLKSLLQHHNPKASVNSSALNLPHVSTLTSVHEYWKNHSFDYMDLPRQNDASSLLIHCLGLSQYSYSHSSHTFIYF